MRPAGAAAAARDLPGVLVQHVQRVARDVAARRQRDLACARDRDRHGGDRAGFGPAPSRRRCPIRQRHRRRPARRRGRCAMAARAAAGPDATVARKSHVIMGLSFLARRDGAAAVRRSGRWRSGRPRRRALRRPGRPPARAGRLRRRRPRAAPSCCASRAAMTPVSDVARAAGRHAGVAGRVRYRRAVGRGDQRPRPFEQHDAAVSPARPG